MRNLSELAKRSVREGRTNAADDILRTTYPGADGSELRLHALGMGRPLVLLHGLMTRAQDAWLAPGHAAVLAGRGFRVLMPDLRGHGDSSAAGLGTPLPSDVLVDDAFALGRWLALSDGEWDLAGYSLGGQVAARMLARGARPRRAVIGAAGLAAARVDRGAAAALRGRLPPALAAVVETLMPVEAEGLADVEVATLVVCGESDERMPACRALAELLPRGHLQVIAGDHGSAALTPRTLGEVMAGFLADAPPESASDAPPRAP